MSQLVFCNDDTCIHNQSGIACTLSRVNMEKEHAISCDNNKIQCYVICRDYEGEEDGTD